MEKFANFVNTQAQSSKGTEAQSFFKITEQS